MSTKQFGPYIVQEVIGRGGMGTVYKATDVNSDEVVAVKALSPTYSFDERFRMRFEAEIDALIQLDHPNIVRLISYGQEDGNLFYAMELIDGESLFDMQKQVGKIEWKKILDIALDVSRGLRHAHDRGIIHRDLKPGNLMMNKEGVTKLGDFGIAKMFGGSQMTADGNVLGTMDFMAPEQAQGKPVTVRSDLYSLGVVIYALLTGRPPFAAESVEETVRKVTAAEIIPIKKLVSDLPDPIAQLIHDLVQKEPENRIQTAQSLIRRLEEIREFLVESSEAKTRIVDEKDDTDFKLRDTDSAATDIRRNTIDEGQTSVNDTRLSDHELASRQTQISNETYQEEKSDAKEKEMPAKPAPDYFSPVTEGQRGGLADHEEPETTFSRVWPLAAGLLATLLLIAFGIYYQTLPESAEALISKIEKSVDRPSRVRDELVAFLEHYPDHEKHEQYETLLRVAEASSFQLSLQRAQNADPLQLTEVEAEFLKISNDADKNPLEGFDNLKAFINVHKPDYDTDETVARCVDAARDYIEKIKLDVAQNEQRIESQREKINERIAQAKELAKTDKTAAIDLLKAIVELYDDEKWASEVHDEVNGVIQAIEKKD